MKSSIKLFAATAIVSYTGLVAAAPTNNSSLAIRDYPPQFMVWKLQHSIDSNDRRYVFWDTWNPMPSCDQLLTHQSFQVSESNDVSKTRGVRVKGSDSTPKEIEYNIGSPYGHNTYYLDREGSIYDVNNNDIGRCTSAWNFFNSSDCTGSDGSTKFWAVLQCVHR